MLRLCLVLLALLSACTVPRRAGPPAAVATVRQAERRLGIEATGNFASASGRRAYDLCFFTGKLELPDSYDGLRWKELKDGRCPADPARFDILTYSPEAVAGRESPVTRALAEAHIERTAFVVAHEDFHDQPEIRRLPASLHEAAATLAGLLTAIEHARLTAGPASAAFEKARGAPEAFARKAERTNALFRRLRVLYSQAETGSREKMLGQAPAAPSVIGSKGLTQSPREPVPIFSRLRGAISREEALARKQREFDRLAAECAGEERFEAFHACPAALNNAGLSFDHTYTRDYPLLWEAHRALGGNPARTVAFLREELPAAGKKAEEIRTYGPKAHRRDGRR